MLTAIVDYLWYHYKYIPAVHGNNNRSICHVCLHNLDWSTNEMCIRVWERTNVVLICEYCQARKPYSAIERAFLRWLRFNSGLNPYQQMEVRPTMLQNIRKAYGQKEN